MFRQKLATHTRSLCLQTSKISDVLAVFRVRHSNAGEHGENIDGGKYQYRVIFCEDAVEY